MDIEPQKQAGFVDGNSLERLRENGLWRVPIPGVFRPDPRVVKPASNEGIHDEWSCGPPIPVLAPSS